MKKKLQPTGPSGVRYRYLKQEGTRLYFRRRSEPRVRLYATPGTAAFEAEYLRAYTGAPIAPPQGSRPRALQRGQVSPDSLDWLIEQYYASAEFADLEDSTRGVRRGTLDRVRSGLDPIQKQRIGGFPFALLDSRAVGMLRDEDKEHPHAGNARVKALR